MQFTDDDCPKGVNFVQVCNSGHRNNCLHYPVSILRGLMYEEAYLRESCSCNQACVHNMVVCCTTEKKEIEKPVQLVFSKFLKQVLTCQISTVLYESMT